MIIGLTVVLLISNLRDISAQITPLASQYYQNQYMGNPALAGMDERLIINLGYRNQWRVIPGSPVTQSLTADYRIDKVGMGLNVYSDNAGLIRRTRLMGSYAYHLPLNAENQSLHFGISLGLLSEKLDNENIVADPNDVLADAFNSRRMYLDGDFGIAYINDRFEWQGALPNLKKFLKKDFSNSADETTFFLSVSYKINKIQDIVSLEPKFCFRGAREFNSLWDVGTDMKFANNLIYVMAMYHSSKSSTIGFGINFQSKVLFQGFYSSQLAALREDSGGSFEIGLKIPLNIQKVPDQINGKIF